MTRKAAAPNARPDLYETITAKIIADLERGVRPWTRPWSSGHLAGPTTRPLRHTLQPYSGVNVLLLWMEAVDRSYTAPIWMTFRQALELGGHVRKGEKGATVVYANRIKRTEQDDDGRDVEREIPFLKAYTVFNVEQIEDLPALYHAGEVPRLDTVARDAKADAFFTATGAVVRHGGDQAAYSILTDEVRMPPFDHFHEVEAYYATLAHELTHWTRHPSRLDRDFGRQRFGDEGYAREELVAELGAAFLCADLGLTLTPREDHAGYIGFWLEVLKNDKRFIVSAAAHAQRACEFLHRLQPAQVSPT